MKNVRILIGGLGNAALPVLELIKTEEARLKRDNGIFFTLVGAADSKGAAYCHEGIDSMALHACKKEKGTAAAMDVYGHPGMTALEMIEACDADIYIEALPPNLPSGEPGTSNIRAAMNKGMHVVTANKAPLALHWKELFDLAAEKGVMLRYGTAAAIALHSLEVGRMLGDGGELLEFSGIFNASCMYVIEEMKNGKSYEEALKGAREGGFLEPNPSMDVDGWDSAMKTVIQTNTYWNRQYTLSDIDIKGIGGLTREDIIRADAKGKNWCMVGKAVMQDDGSIKLSSGPECLPKDHPVGRATWCDKVVLMKTRTQGDQVHYSFGSSAAGTPGNIFLDTVLIASKL